MLKMNENFVHALKLCFKIPYNLSTAQSHLGTFRKNICERTTVNKCCTHQPIHILELLFADYKNMKNTNDSSHPP